MKNIVPNKKIAATGALFGTAIIWGSSFFVTKNTFTVFPPNLLLAFRFLIAFVILALIFRKRFKKLDKSYVLAGLVIGLISFFAYSLQTVGLQYTTPGKNAFLTAANCIIVPFLFWAVSKKRPDIFQVVAGIIVLAGIGFVSLNADFTINSGDLLTIISAFFFAAQIVAIARLIIDKDIILVTIMQFGITSLLCFTASLFGETFNPMAITPVAIAELLYLAAIATAAAMLFQNISQKYIHPSTVAIILALESVFGVLFSVIFYNERLTAQILLGFILIFIAVIIAETKLSFFKRRGLMSSKHRK